MLDEEEKGEFLREEKRPLVTRVFEEGTFVPTAKLTNEQKLSIATNYMGTPEAMYREDGEAVWKCELSSYGKVRKFQGEFKTDCPFRYQGQYEDSETGLYYNGFRYYDCDTGNYISQDPIRLRGGVSLYSYVHNPNSWIDVLGLDSVYYRDRDKQNPGTKKPYVGSAKDGIDNRYPKSELEGNNGRDVFQKTPDHDTTRGVEQLVYERGKENYGNSYWDNINNPVSPSHIGGDTYKDKKDKYTYRTDIAKEYLTEAYGEEGEDYNDVIDRIYFGENNENGCNGE